MQLPQTYRSKIIAYTIILVIFLAGSQLYSFSQAQKTVLQESERSLSRNILLFKTNLNAEKIELERFVEIVRSDKRLQESVFVVVKFDSGKELLHDMYEKNFGWLPISHRLICDNQGNIILGSENTDLIDFATQACLRKMHASHYTMSRRGIELAVTLPIFYNKNQLGTVVLTRSLDDAWMKRKKDEGSGQLFIEHNGIVEKSTLAGLQGTAFSPKNGHIVIGKESYRLYNIALNSESRTFPKLWFGVSVTQITKNLSTHKNESLIQVLVGFFFIVFLAVFLNRNFQRPLTQLAALTQKIADGQLPEVKKSVANSELDILANKFADMVQSLREKDEQVKRVHRDLEKTAITDSLTGLHNRRAFESSLERIVKNAKFGRKSHALCYLDLDQFKIVNDTCGHEAGDELLRQLTTLLKSRLRGSDILARLGGDEFGLIMSDITQTQAQTVADELLVIVKEYRFSWADKFFDIGVSIGLVMIDKHSESFAEVLRHADISCYAAKNEGRNRVHFYLPSKKDSSLLVEEINWLQTLRDALEEDNFELWFQPIASINEGDKCDHGEILLRLRGNNGEIISPGAFIPAAERYQFMPKIDRWVFSNALKFIRERLCSDAHFWYSINLSGLTLNDPAMLAFIHERLKQEQIPGSVICFEITETAAIHNLSNAITFVSSLKASGCRFALDDFGAGLSSFRHLRHLPVDFIKIDGSFVVNILKNPIDEGMVHAINQIAHLMGKETIAEFVEEVAVHNKLKEIGVDYVQGYLIGKPAPFTTKVSDGSLQTTTAPL